MLSSKSDYRGALKRRVNTCTFVVRAVGSSGRARAGLEVGMKFPEVVPQTDPSAQVPSSELCRKFRRELGDLLQVGCEVVLEATAVL
jgi:hypothetical protein